MPCAIMVTFDLIKYLCWCLTEPIVHGVACPPLFMLEKLFTVQGKLNLSQFPNVVFKMLPCISPSSRKSFDIAQNCRHSEENKSAVLCILIYM